MKIILIIQARMSSTRLPGKILKKIEDKTVLHHVINRCSKSKYINKIIIATTTNPLDDVLEEYCIHKNLNYYRGSEENVLERFYQCVKNDISDIIIRVTSDCPLIDVNIIDDMITYFIENKLSFLQPYYFNTGKHGAHGGFPDGTNPQIFKFDILKKTRENVVTDFDKEHVCPYMVRNFANDEYIIPNIQQYKNIDFSSLHLSLDTAEDYKFISHIYKKLYRNNEDFSIYDVLSLINEKGI